MKQNLTGKLPDSLVSIAQLIFLTKLLAPPAPTPPPMPMTKWTFMYIQLLRQG